MREYHHPNKAAFKSLLAGYYSFCSQEGANGVQWPSSVPEPYLRGQGELLAAAAWLFLDMVTIWGSDDPCDSTEWFVHEVLPECRRSDIKDPNLWATAVVEHMEVHGRDAELKEYQELMATAAEMIDQLMGKKLEVHDDTKLALDSVIADLRNYVLLRT